MNAEIHHLLAKSRTLPHGFARFDLAREAVRLADLTNDLTLRFDSRLILVEAATFSNHPAELIVHFTWLLNHREAYGDAADRTLLWNYKWVLSNVKNVASFSKEQVEYFHRDSRKRYEAYLGPEARPLDMLEVGYLIQLGDYPGAKKLLEKVERTPRGELSDCYACEESARSLYWGMLGEPSRAFQAYEDLMETRQGCTQEPVLSSSQAAFFYAAAGRRDEARAAYQSAIVKAEKNDSLIEHCHRYLMGASFLLGENADAVALFDRSFEIYSTTIRKQDYFEYCLIGHRLMESLLEHGHAELTLKCAGLLPFTTDPADGRVGVKQFSDWLLDQAAETGATFDRRNGVSRFSQLVAARWPLAAPPVELA